MCFVLDVHILCLLVYAITICSADRELDRYISTLYNDALRPGIEVCNIADV